MRGKIVLAVVGFISVVSIGLTMMLFNITPITLQRQTFNFQMNDQLPTNLDYYVRANENILEKCTLHIEEVDSSIIAVYPAYIMYQDQRFDFQVMIEDKEKPVIELKNETAVISCFTGAKFVAADLVDVQDDTKTIVYFEDKNGEALESITLTKEGSVDYYIYATDSSKNQSKSIRVRFEVGVDYTKPTITGADPKTLKVGDSFDPYEGVTAYDNADGEITKQIIVSGEVYTSTVGQYRLTYTVSDVSGNKTEVVRTITVTQSGDLGQVDVGDGPFLTDDEIASRDAQVQSLLESELDYFNEATFVKRMNQYLMNNFVRSGDDDDSSSYAVIVRQKGTRMGMVRAVKVILDARGIENYIVNGESKSWNIVKVNGEYRHLDVYANAYYQDENYCYLLKTSELESSYDYDTTLYPRCN